jgi:hypothetical protein
MQKLKAAAGDAVQLLEDLHLVVGDLGAGDGRHVSPWCLRSCGEALLIFLHVFFSARVTPG